MRPPPPQPRARALALLLRRGPSPFEATRQPSKGRPETENVPLTRSQVALQSIINHSIYYKYLKKLVVLPQKIAIFPGKYIVLKKYAE